MIVPFFDTNAGTTVCVNPEYLVTLRPTRLSPSGPASSNSATARPSGFKERTWRRPPSWPARRRQTSPLQCEQAASIEVDEFAPLL